MSTWVRGKGVGSGMALSYWIVPFWGHDGTLREGGVVAVMRGRMVEARRYKVACILGGGV